jgi:small subunit ribosomal protein S21
LLLIKVTVHSRNIDFALSVLAKKVQREGLNKELKNRRAFESKPKKRARKASEARRRRFKYRRPSNG